MTDAEALIGAVAIFRRRYGKYPHKGWGANNPFLHDARVVIEAVDAHRYATATPHDVPSMTLAEAVDDSHTHTEPTCASR